MKDECNIIRDILPLYIDEIASTDSILYVEKHLENCEVCRCEYEKMKSANIPLNDSLNTIATDANQLKKFKKKWNRRTMIKGFIVAVLLMLFLIGACCGYHFGVSANSDDMSALRRQAEEYIGKESLAIMQFSQRDDYAAALCKDSAGSLYLCVYERDSLFPNRWRTGGGIAGNGFKEGEVNSWNFVNPDGDAVLVFCGSNIPAEAYTFVNEKTVYTIEIEGNCVLDIFIISDSNDINGAPTLLDSDRKPLNN